MRRHLHGGMTILIHRMCRRNHYFSYFLVINKLVCIIGRCVTRFFRTERRKKRAREEVEVEVDVNEEAAREEEEEVKIHEI